MDKNQEGNQCHQIVPEILRLIYPYLTEFLLTDVMDC